MFRRVLKSMQNGHDSEKKTIFSNKNKYFLMYLEDSLVNIRSEKIVFSVLQNHLQSLGAIRNPKA